MCGLWSSGGEFSLGLSKSALQGVRIAFPIKEFTLRGLCTHSYHVSTMLISLDSTDSTCPFAGLSRRRGGTGACLVPPHVLFAVDDRAEALLTERALVRLQAHVRRHVPGEAAIGGERRVANAAAECLHA